MCVKLFNKQGNLDFLKENKNRLTKKLKENNVQQEQLILRYCSLITENYILILYNSLIEKFIVTLQFGTCQEVWG